MNKIEVQMAEFKASSAGQWEAMHQLINRASAMMVGTEMLYIGMTQGPFDYKGNPRAEAFWFEHLDRLHQEGRKLMEEFEAFWKQQK